MTDSLTIFSTGEGIAGESMGVLPEPGMIEGLSLPQVGPPTGEEASLLNVDPKPGVAGGAPAPRLEKEKCANSAPQPFHLSAGLAPVPARLVEKIQNLFFVDMAELVRDNQRRAAAQDQPSSSTPAIQLNTITQSPEGDTRSLELGVLFWDIHGGAL